MQFRDICHVSIEQQSGLKESAHPEERRNAITHPEELVIVVHCDTQANLSSHALIHIDVQREPEGRPPMDPLLQRIVGNPVQHLLARSSAPWKKTMLQRRGAKKRQRQQTPRKDAEAPPAVSNNADALLVGLQTFSCYSCPASLDSRLLAATPVRLRGAVRLTCPLLMTGRIRTPVVGKRCRHLQCFDLWNYIATTRKQSNLMNRWRCPVCSLATPPEDLTLDYLAQSLLQNKSGQRHVEDGDLLRFELVDPSISETIQFHSKWLVDPSISETIQLQGHLLIYQ
jgi:hypothetical protein